MLSGENNSAAQFPPYGAQFNVLVGGLQNQTANNWDVTVGGNYNKTDGIFGFSGVVSLPAPTPTP
jgi:hypothetical protein